MENTGFDLQLNRKWNSKKQRDFIELVEQEMVKVYSQLIPKEQLPIAQSLIKELAFMMLEMRNNKKIILEEGSTYVMQNGNQEVLAQHPASKNYLSIVPKYNSTFNTLNKMIPETEDKEETNELLKKFMMKNA